MITTDINIAKEELIKNELVAIPTETVYGLAGNAFNDSAIQKIFDLKKRPNSNPLIVHIKSSKVLHELATDIPQKAQKLADVFWPGPLTLVLKKRFIISDLITAGKETVAIRVPNHPMTLQLLQELEFPLVAPSANSFGAISPTCSEHVQDYFKDHLNVILDGGNCIQGIESTIIGFENHEPILYRYGSLPIEEIEEIIGPVRIHIHDNNYPEAPGMMSKHYAPKTTTYLTQNVSHLIELFKGQKIGVIVFQNEVNSQHISFQEVLSNDGNFNEASKNLYGAMHRLDKQNLDIIIAEKIPDKNLGKSINDRLKRASNNTIENY